MNNTNRESNIVKNEKNRPLIVRCLITSGFLALYCLAFGFFSLLFIHNDSMAGIIKVLIGLAFMIPMIGLIIGEATKLAKSEFTIANRGNTENVIPKKIPPYTSFITLMPLVSLILILCVLGVCLGQKFIFFQTAAIHLSSPISLVFLGLDIVKISVVSPLSLIPVVCFLFILVVLFLVSFKKEENRLIDNHKKIASEIKFNSRFIKK